LIRPRDRLAGLGAAQLPNRERGFRTRPVTETSL
jgi:hypothetical protein